MIELKAAELAGERGGEPVFQGLSFQVRGGEALAVTGPNGVGKSTLLRVIAGLLPVHQGYLAFTGGCDDFPDVQSACHYLGHKNAMKTAMGVEENLAFWRDFLGHPHLEPWEALDMMGLGDIAHLPFGYLSTGQRRRVAIARLLVSYRPVWLLDEPTAGLDVASEVQFAELMGVHLEEGGLIIAATHLPLGLEGAGQLKMGEARA